MDRLIAVHFANPLSPSTAFNSMAGLKRFYGNDASLAQIRRGLSRVRGYALKRRPRPVRPRNPYYVFRWSDLVEMDLAHLPGKQLAAANDGVSYLLFVINAFSRRLYVRPLKNKSAAAVLPQIRSIFREMGGKIKSCRSDRGGEFVDQRVQNFFNYHNIDHRVPRANEKTSLCERVIGTVKRMIYSFLADQDTLRYLDDLPYIVHNYNARRHSTTKLSPYAADRPENHDQVLRTALERIAKLSVKVQRERRRQRRRGTALPAVHAGSLVRRLTKEKPRTFKKSHDNFFTPEIYEVTHVSTHLLRPLYSLAPVNQQGGTGPERRELYYRHELRLVNPGINRDTFPEFQILERRVNPASGRDEVLLRFTDYPKRKYQTWMVEDQLNAYLSRQSSNNLSSEDEDEEEVRRQDGIVSIADDPSSSSSDSD